MQKRGLSHDPPSVKCEFEVHFTEHINNESEWSDWAIRSVAGQAKSMCFCMLDSQEIMLDTY